MKNNELERLFKEGIAEMKVQVINAKVCIGCGKPLAITQEVYEQFQNLGYKYCQFYECSCCPDNENSPCENEIRRINQK